MAPTNVSTTLILILTALLSAAAAPHKPTAPPSLANTTMPGGRCLSNNSTSILLSANGTALLKDVKTQRILGMVTKLSSEDTLLIQHHVHRERMYSALYLYARNRTVSSTQQDELGQHAENLGLSRGAVVYAPWRKDAEQQSPALPPAAALGCLCPARQRCSTEPKENRTGNVLRSEKSRSTPGPRAGRCQRSADTSPPAVPTPCCSPAAKAQGRAVGAARGPEDTLSDITECSPQIAKSSTWKSSALPGPCRGNCSHRQHPW
ncbi:uncharacterized protein LOC122184111 isoform X3 [Lagopus leucura]|uniref:uncharacterized protein LOC122184111 isoform X3 n=1 Tax=Lagopus leucura TaxID=30410 RepID=UPI001C67F5AE|nr:uncharacterized protein LOC122184111 isoform X3 [Lagopus leucura]